MVRTHKVLYMNIAKSIRVGLATAELSTQDVIKCVDKTPQTVSYWMNNKAEPKFSDIEKLAKLFNVKVSAFIAWGE
ncbi:DNA-binding domain protein [Vibrio phage 1.158.O._10N.261.45.E12]|nr:DNA-binding domain protein [Vibrio phage 1.086.O._10N.222.51.F8]AUR87402.1 DNA-binding domain protein [Vibrio phage 1.100.O._10N.261.45.C3]AUR91291.1 DNA-binding domain protein [Vibrio phage 1.158.O._10N.261.45.E12]AUR92694.1 DNA-binding domain protein [Vibrio phage 1.175.O._10N.261.55.B3]AUR96360.1 DNA-binding domain protein [Vibrio phage 1.223.O._10N.261.48.A9]AUR96520.1 DNA-binding domain protein [Vibrio phage 1.225.O._10N.261.48.B7]AUR98066.1 DNA-binding domain protein [Vibrio phage 1.